MHDYIDKLLNKQVIHKTLGTLQITWTKISDNGECYIGLSNNTTFNFPKSFLGGWLEFCDEEGKNIIYPFEEELREKDRLQQEKEEQKLLDMQKLIEEKKCRDLENEMKIMEYEHYIEENKRIRREQYIAEQEREKAQREEFEKEISEKNKIWMEEEEKRIIEKKAKIDNEYAQYAYFKSVPELERNQLKVPFNKTNKNVIYIYEYHPVDDLPGDEVRKAMLQYKSYSGKKDDDKIVFSNFTHDIYYLLKKIIKEYQLTNNIYLVSIPCHLKEKISPINFSIKTIIKWTTNGHELQCNLVDYSDLLIRSTDIDEEKKGTRDIEKQLSSMDISRLLNSESTYILLDDITTSGTIMDACVKKMTENGANESNIIRVAITSTSRRVALTSL